MQNNKLWCRISMFVFIDFTDMLFFLLFSVLCIRLYTRLFFQLFWLLSVWMDWIWFTFFVLAQFQRVIFQANKTYNKKNTLSHTSKAKASSWRPRELIIRIEEWLSQLFSIAFRRIVIETDREKEKSDTKYKRIGKSQFYSLKHLNTLCSHAEFI